MQAQADPIVNECFVPLYSDSLHDLSGPVNQISTMFELFLKRYRKQGAGGDDVVLDLIHDSTVRLQRLLGALQNYSKVLGGSYEIRSCDSGALLRVALTSLDSAIQESAARVKHGEMPRVECDPNQLVFVFTSLIENAIKFRSEAEPEIEISVESRTGEWVFSVRDNGIGIQTRHRQSVFHIFKRLNGDRYSGAGAGLAISHDIIQRHGGKIWLESEPGSGTTFFFSLPCAHGTQRA